MTLSAGSRLGPYEILAPIGAGGMGEVYRARDGKLGRDVAIKVLPAAFAADPERLSRFRREAQVLASLNHPHIAAIYGLEGSDGVEALVLELVEGETLAERIAGGAIPVDEALPIAREIALALEAAHEKGIVHRDLKPANVKITPEGKVKVLDFGLAKALTGDASSPDATSSPTLTARSTQAGVVIGTAAYMSPEQARGRAVDKRADIWAFGAVLYEMLTGRRAFEGETVSDTLAAVLMREPNWSALPAPTPAPVRRVLRRCLDRDTRTRIRDIADARLDLDEAFAEPTAPEAAAAAASVLARRRLPLGALLAAAAAVGALLTALVLARLRPSAAQPPVVRSLTDSGRDWFPAASPDGKLVAFVSDRDGRQRIWLKQIPDGDETALTSGPDDRPRFSPDGSAVLFVRREGDGSSLFRVGVLGGEPRRLVADAYDGAWSPDGRRLAFTREGQDGDRRSWALYVASADGSDPREIHRSTQGLFEWPVWSPDGKRIVCYPRFVGVSSGAWPLLLVDSSGGGSRPLDSSSLQARSPAVWLGEGDELLLARASDVAGLDASPSDLYVMDAQSGRETKVFASPNRISALDVLGRGRIVFDVNSNRYNLREVPLEEGGAAAAWLTRGLGLNRQPRYAPDGDWILFSALRGDNLDVWSVQPRTGAVRRLTDSPAGDFDPALTSDGRQLIWSSDRGGHFEIWMGNADGSGPRQVSSDGVDAENGTATPDGKWIVYASGNPKKLGIWKVRSDGSEPTVLVPGLADWPEVSPDGKHVVFASERFTHQSAIRVARLEDGAVLPFAIPLGATIGRLGLIAGRARWTPDGRSIAFVNFDERGLPGVFVQEFAPDRDTSATRRALAGFDTEWAPETFAISPDGKKICLAEWEQVSSVMTAEGVPGVQPPVRLRAP